MAGTSSKVPIEITNDEVKASTEAALTSAACSHVTSTHDIPAIHSPTSDSSLHGNTISIQSDSVQTNKRSFVYAVPDIEDYGNLVATRKKSKADDTLLHRFRSKRGLFVTDFANTEWCDMQTEFSLLFKESKNNEPEPVEEWYNQEEMDLALDFGGGRKNYEAMQAGIDRHVQLQQEVIKQVRVKVKSCEDLMALKLVNFINGVNQLLSEGLTRELPIVSYVFSEGTWMVGKIDEIQMPKAKEENDHNPVLVETKTRSQDTVPKEPQKRKGRIQLMCYKYLWDNLVAHADHDFPSKQLFDYFELNPQHTLNEDLQELGASSGISALTLGDVVTSYQNKCKMLHPAHDQLVLRYESQKDRSLLHEEKLAYDADWIKYQIRNCLEFWRGQRKASYVAEQEQWKCDYCKFASECPAYTDIESTESLSIKLLNVFSSVTFSKVII